MSMRKGGSTSFVLKSESGGIRSLQMGLAHAIIFLGVFMSTGVLDQQIHQRIFDLYQGI